MNLTKVTAEEMREWLKEIINKGRSRNINLSFGLKTNSVTG